MSAVALDPPGDVLSRPRRMLSSKKNSEVFAVGDDHILKLFRDHVPLERIEREAAVSQLVHGTGLPCPRVESGVVRHHDGRGGIVFERARGQPLSEAYRERPARIVHWTRLIAQVHRRIHDTPAVAGLPPQKRGIAEDVLSAGKLSLDARKIIVRTLESLPEGTSLCHSDLHPSNIIVDRDRATVIDWGGAVNGNPLCDVARTTIILRYPVAKLGDYGERAARIYCALRSVIYLRAYFRGRPAAGLEFRRWLAVLAAARLKDELTPRTSQRLLQLIAGELPRLRAALAHTA